MELVAIIATIILVATLLTLMFSFAAYFVTRAKKLIPKKVTEKPTDNTESKQRVYFKRYLPEGMYAEDKTDIREKYDSQWM